VYFAQFSPLSAADNCFELYCPPLLVGGTIVSVSLIGYLPGPEGIAEAIAEQILQF
jgi:hypothetical protein